MSELSDFVAASAEQISAARVGREQFRSKAVCVCGHSEGSHIGQRQGLVSGTSNFFEVCQVGRTECACKKFIPVIETNSVLPFRAKPGRIGNAHPLIQGIQRLLANDPDAEIRKLDAWKCAAPGCGQRGQLIPIYLEGMGENAMPVNRDTGVTVLACALHQGGA